MREEGVCEGRRECVREEGVCEERRYVVCEGRRVRRECVKGGGRM